jgi:hypothetical protein
MSDPDDIDEVFRDIRCFAERSRKVTPVEDRAFAGMPQIDTDGPPVPEDELILGEDYVTYLVFADEHEMADFSISAEDDFIEVKTEDFTVKKEFGLRVDPDGPSTTYTNGILSVKLKRIAER